MDNRENGKETLDKMTLDIINKSSQSKKLTINGVNISKIVACLASSSCNLMDSFVEEETDIYFKKPSEISDNLDEKKRNNDLYLFQLLDGLYTTPLYEMANRISLNNYRRKAVFSNLVDASILERLITIRKFLQKNGMTLSQIKKAIPVKEEDFIILADAYEKGFALEDYSNGKDLSNDSRVRRAKEYLEKQDSNDYDGKSK